MDAATPAATPTGPPAASTVQRAPVRDRVLDTAAELFAGQGVHAVGVDLIVERAGIAKTSLYRHFATKDALIAAVLDRDDAAYWRDWDRIAADHPGRPADELVAHLEWIAADTVRPGFRGCPFLSIATEFPDPGHPARRVAVRHKDELRRRLRELAAAVPVADPATTADQLVLLVDGAYVDGELLGPDGPARTLPATGRLLLGLPAAG